MKKRIPDIVCGLLIFLFVYAAVTKLLDRRHFEEVLSKMILTGDMSPVISILLPAIEISVSVMLLIPAMRLKGLYASFCLLVLFTLYIGSMIAFAGNLPCNCGGVLEKMNWHQHLIFNLFFIVLSVIGIRQYRVNEKEFAIHRLSDQQPQEGS